MQEALEDFDEADKEFEAALSPSRKAAIARTLKERTELARTAPAPAINATIAQRGLSLTTRALEAWNARLAGAPIVDLAHELGLSIGGAKALIAEAHAAIAEDLKTNLELNRQLDLDRVDNLIRAFYQGARSGHIKSAELVLKALAHRSKLCGIEPTFREPGHHKPENILVWIQQQLPSINRIVEAIPVESP